jgi:hypothetical protein
LVSNFIAMPGTSKKTGRKAYPKGHFVSKASQRSFFKALRDVEARKAEKKKARGE